MSWVQDIDSLYDFIGYVVVSAPDRFPIEDFLSAEEQMTLDRAFVELRHGLTLVDPEVADEQKRPRLSSLLEASLDAYRSGDMVKGAHLLQDFQDLIFKPD